MNIKLVEAWEKHCPYLDKNPCSKLPKGTVFKHVICTDCFMHWLSKREKLINEQIAQAVKDAYRKGQQSIDTKANLPDAG